MIEVYSGSGLWEELAPILEVDGHREAAIAYIGRDANDHLRLKKDDVLVFDGDDKSIRQNLVHLPTISKLMRAGVRLYSCPGLHAKMLVIEGDSPAALVGSANASQTSVNDKIEAVVHFDDPAAVMAVRLAISQWYAGSKRLDRAWLSRVSKLPREPWRRGSRWKAPTGDDILADQTKPLWITDWTADTVSFTAAEKAALLTARESPGVWVESFRLRSSRYEADVFDDVALEDSIIMIPWTLTTRRPRANGRVYEPAKIIQKLPSKRGRGGLILVAWRQEYVIHHWRDIEAVISPQGEDFDSWRLSDASRDAVFALFGDA